MFDLEGGNRIIARPSGTEPKIKFYFDVREPIEKGEEIVKAEARAGERLNALAPPVPTSIARNASSGSSRPVIPNDRRRTSISPGTKISTPVTELYL